MGALMTAVNAVVTAVEVIREEEGPATQLARLEAVVRLDREDLQVCLGLCRGFLAYATGQGPESDLVNAVFANALERPGFPQRARRYFGEMLKTSSRRRQAFLAAALFGLQFEPLPDDERDRIDMAVERMMPEDAALLYRIAEKQNEPPAKKTEGPLDSTSGKSKTMAIFQEDGVRLVATNDQAETATNLDAFDQEHYGVDAAAIANLQTLGCIRLMRPEGSYVDRYQLLTITNVGALVIRALDDVRGGFESAKNPPAT
jgi:hypothetical protein